MQRGGNFTQIWNKESDLHPPSSGLIADVNFRQRDDGENTPALSRRNAAYIAAMSPDVSLQLVQRVRELEAENASMESMLEAYRAANREAAEYYGRRNDERA